MLFSEWLKGLNISFQHNMKRRLHYAMPRVSIEKLKADQGFEEMRDVETREKKTSFTKAVATTLLKQVKRKRKQEDKPELEERNSDTSEDETHLEDTLLAEVAPTDNDKNRYYEDDYVEEKGIRNQQKTKDVDAFPRIKNPQHLNLTENAMKKMKDAEVILQRANRGKKLRVVVVESDGEDADAHNDVTDHNDFQWDIAGHFTVQADVHQVGSERKEEESVKENHFVILQSEENDVVSHSEVVKILKEDELGHSGRARPKQRKPDVAFHEKKQKAKKKQRTGHKRNKKHHGDHKNKKEKKTEVKWGLDESSESDGGWGCDEGYVALLPR